MCPKIYTLKILNYIDTLLSILIANKVWLLNSTFVSQMYIKQQLLGIYLFYDQSCLTLNTHS